MTNFLSTRQAAAILNYHPNTVAALAQQGKIEGHKDRRGRWQLSEESVRGYEPQEQHRPKVINRAFTASDSNGGKGELAQNRALLAERIRAARLTKAVYLLSDGREVSRQTWLKG